MKVLIHYDTPDAMAEILARRHGDVDIAACRDYDSLPEILETFAPEVMFTIRFAGTPGFPRDAILAAPSLKWISVGGSGTDHFGQWDPAAVTITNAAGVAADMMAQYTMGTILAFALDLPGFRRSQDRREWGAGRVAPIDGKSILVIGLGKTGQAIAKRAKALDLHVIGVRARPQPTANVDEVHGQDTLADLWGRADYVAVCVPLTDGTRGLVGAGAFAAIKPGAVLVDVSRGGVVSEKPLLAALGDGRLAGAALDVFETEPLPADHPFWGMDNVIVTPHCSSVYDGWELRSMEMFCDNLERWKRGQPLENVVDPTRGY